MRFTMPWEYLCLCVRGPEANVCPDFALFLFDEIDGLCLSADPRSIPGGSAVCGTQLVTNFPMLSVKQSSDGGQANDRRQEGTNGGAVSGRRKNSVTVTRPSGIIAPATDRSNLVP